MPVQTDMSGALIAIASLEQRVQHLDEKFDVLDTRLVERIESLRDMSALQQRASVLSVEAAVRASIDAALDKLVMPLQNEVRELRENQLQVKAVAGAAVKGASAVVGVVSAVWAIVAVFVAH